MVRSKIVIEHLNLWFDDNHVLKNINLHIPEQAVTAIMGAIRLW